MTGKIHKTLCSPRGWPIAVLAALLLGPALSFAQIPQLSFSETPPAPPSAESFHSTHCQFPTGSPVSLREPGTTAADTSGSTGVVPAGCSTCNSGALESIGGCSHCAGGCVHAGRLPCYPGRKPYCGEDDCHPPPSEPATCLGRFAHGVWECVCCLDPCYEGKWIPIADAAFFAAAPRPVTQTRIRWNAGLNVRLPDRSEFFWARADGGPGAKGPPPPPASTGRFVIDRFNYNDIVYSFEASTGMMSVITEIPYRSQDLPDYPGQNSGHFAGFGDIKVGLKSLIFDCPLLQVATQFLTYTPSGSPGKGLGTGHVSLEPSLLVGIRLGHDTYFQHQLSEWIPLGGDPLYSGAVLHTHSSLNQVLYRFRPDVPLIATAELQSWSFQDGAYTDPILGPYQGSSGTTYASFGPGLRLFVCDRIDFGVASQYALSHSQFWGQYYSTEFRWRF